MILGFLEKVLWLTIEVGLGLLFRASITPYPTSKVVILTLTTHPATVRERKVLLLPLVARVALEL